MKLLHLETLQTVDTLYQKVACLLQELMQTEVEPILSAAGMDVAWFSDIQVRETQSRIVLTLRVLDVVPDSLELEVTQQSVWIRGQRRVPTMMQDYFDLEFYGGRFESRFSLPAMIEPDAVTAELQGNVLKLNLKKSWDVRRSMKAKLTKL